MPGMGGHMKKRRFKAQILSALTITLLTALTPLTAQASVPDEDEIQSIISNLKKQCEESRWQNLGYIRTTEYCGTCNDPAGHQSSSGAWLTDGMAACNWLPNGTRIRVNGQEYTVTDYCGTDAIDLFRDTDGCYCNLNQYQKVEVYEK